MFVAGIAPEGYKVTYHPGRSQPFTCHYKRGKRWEVFAFTETHLQAMSRIHYDDPDEVFEEELALV